MRKLYLLIELVVFGSIIINAQTTENANTLSYGFQLGQYQNDFGLGLNLTSPYFAKNTIAFRIRGNILWNEHILLENTVNNTVWSPYLNTSLGVVGTSSRIGDYIRIYGEGGIVVLFPSSEFSSEDSEFGGYGIFGFEFFASKDNNFCYFLEVGGVGTGAIANRIINNPIYSNGLLINVGLRF